MMMRILAFGLLTVGTLVALAPSASAYTWCSNHLYDPLTGDPLVQTCDDYYYYNGCWYDYYYVNEPVYLSYAYSEYCGGEGYTCYLGLLYLDGGNVRTGLC